MTSCRLIHVLLTGLLICSFARAEESPSPDLIQVTVKQADGTESVIIGRIHVEAQDGGMMLEDRTGSIQSLQAAQIVKRESTETPFSFLPTDDLAANLLQRHGDTFQIVETDHFLLCSDASEIYTNYCGRLLEAVLSKYLDFFEDSELKLNSLDAKLQVVIFRNRTTFSEFARQQHPEADFSDVPGYYSIRDNQMLVTAISGDKTFRRESDLVRELKTNRRQVETIVHEAIHQLAFNTGLQVRYAANPMWLSEGLAVYFEGTSGSGPLAWTRPGETSRIHLPTLKQLGTSQRLPIPLTELLGSDAAFLAGDQGAFAYAESWALTHFLINRHRPAFDRLLIAYQQARPLALVSPKQHIETFFAATESTPNDMTVALRRHIAGLRTPR